MSDLLNPSPEEIPPRKYKIINDKKVAYREVGSGPVIFCIPPWPSSSLAYFQISELLKKDFRIIAVDLPGFGGESETLGEFSLESFGLFVKEFIESFEIANYFCIGYSFGGMLTQYCIGKNYINPEKVIYVSTLHSADEVYGIGKIYFELFDATKTVIHDLNSIRRFIEWVYLVRWKIKNRTEPSIAKSLLLKVLIREDTLADANMIFNMWEKLKDENVLNENLKKVPSAILYGTKDPEFIQKESKELAEYLNIVPVAVEGDHDNFAFYADLSVSYVKNFFKVNKFSFTHILRNLKFLFKN